MTYFRRATLSAGSAIAVAVFVGIGCSNNVTTNDGSGGGKTTSATTVTNATISATVGTTSSGSTSAVSTTGGGTACDQACAKAAGCGFDFCANFQLNCGSPVQACAADCINNSDCTAIQSLQTQMPNSQLVGCLVACQQGGTGGAGGAGGGTAAGCGGCIQMQGCFPQGCFGNAECQAWGQCALGCGNQGPSCFTACDTAHPGASSFYQQFYSCACSNCDAKCGAPMDPCSHLPPNGVAASSSVASTGTGN